MPHRTSDYASRGYVATTTTWLRARVVVKTRASTYPSGPSRYYTRTPRRMPVALILKRRESKSIQQEALIHSDSSKSFQRTVASWTLKIDFFLIPMIDMSVNPRLLFHNDPYLCQWIIIIKYPLNTNEYDKENWQKQLWWSDVIFHYYSLGICK